MEQLILYLVIIIIFSVVGYIRKAARKAAAQQQQPMRQSTVQMQPQQAQNARSNPGMQDIESLLRSVLGEENATMVSRPVVQDYTQEGRMQSFVQDEMVIEEGVSTLEKTYGKEMYQKMMNEGVSEIQKSEIELFSEPKIRVNPLMTDFDLRKAVIYAEILKPKFASM